MTLKEESATTGKVGGLISPLKTVIIQPPKGYRERRPVEQQIHLPVLIPIQLLLIPDVLPNQLLVRPTVQM